MNFISMITKSKEEAERDREEEEQSQAVNTDADRAVRSPAEKAMDRAEREAVKSARTLDKQPEPRDRVFSTIRSPDIELPVSATQSTHLPVVQEAGEGSCTGDRSGQSGSNSHQEPLEHVYDDTLNFNLQPNTFRTTMTPPGPPPARPPPPPKDSPARVNGRAF